MVTLKTKPMSKENTFYFSHDYNTRSDMKIQRLITKKGYLGYGLFWALIENLYNNANALPLEYDVIAFDLRTDEDTIKCLINDFDLFIIKDGYFGSNSVQRRLEERELKSSKARKSAFDRWNKTKNDANALQTQSDSNAIKESKVKESKINESKINESKINKVFTPPSQIEVETYFIENGYTKESGIKAFNYYASNNWKDGKGNQVKNWKQKMIGVWFKEENKISLPTQMSFEEIKAEQRKNMAF